MQKVFIKKQSAIQLDDEPIRLLKAIEEMKARIRELESEQQATEERYQRFAGEAGWLRRELASGDLILKDIAKIDTTESDAKLCQQALKRIQKDLKTAKASLERMIERFNRQWLSVDVDEPIK